MGIGYDGIQIRRSRKVHCLHCGRADRLGPLQPLDFELFPHRIGKAAVIEHTLCSDVHKNRDADGEGCQNENEQHCQQAQDNETGIIERCAGLNMVGCSSCDNNSQAKARGQYLGARCSQTSIPPTDIKPVSKKYWKRIGIYPDTGPAPRSYLIPARLDQTERMGL